eukprot:4300462-Pleurochrysis_carterae.AAC.1
MNAGKHQRLLSHVRDCGKTSALASLIENSGRAGLPVDDELVAADIVVVVPPPDALAKALPARLAYHPVVGRVRVVHARLKNGQKKPGLSCILEKTETSCARCGVKSDGKCFGWSLLGTARAKERSGNFVGFLQ